MEEHGLGKGGGNWKQSWKAHRGRHTSSRLKLAALSYAAKLLQQAGETQLRVSASNYTRRVIAMLSRNTTWRHRVLLN